MVYDEIQFINEKLQEFKFTIWLNSLKDEEFYKA